VTSDEERQMSPAIPRAVAFYQAEGEEASPSWRVVAWGLRHPDGWIAVASPNPPRTVSLWPNVEEAEAALEAFVDIPRGNDAEESSA
jgi:hypothetical protein